VACGGGGQTNRGGDQQDAGSGTVTVQAEEYAFTGVPETLAAGEVTFDLENVGEEQNEFQLARLKTDITVEEALELSDDELGQHIEQVGGTLAEPGALATFETTLQAGRYAYVCFLPSPDGTPHAALGMHGELTVS
jgi:uncharacterized cupredoxin-like copper-binding protein